VKKLRVLHVISGLGQGGAEAMLYKLVSHIDKKRFESTVIVMTSGGAYVEKLESIGVPVYMLNMKTVYGILMSFFRYRRLLKCQRPDLVQSWMYHANVFTAVMRPFCIKTRLVQNIRASLANFKNYKVMTRCVIRLNAWVSRFSDIVVNNSMRSQQQHHGIGFLKPKDIFIPNGFDETVFYPSQGIYSHCRKLFGLKPSSRLIGMFARYHPIKNHRAFLEVARVLLDSGLDNCCFVLAGEFCVKANNALLRSIQDLGLEKKIRLLGEVDASRYLPALDVHLLTSLEEGFPNVVGESMFCGVPCVVTNVGDCARVVSEYGFVSQPNDIDSLAENCLKALKMTDEERARMRDYAVAHYSIHSVVKQYEDLYSSLVDNQAEVR